MRVEDTYRTPSGYIKMILHKGGQYDIEKGTIVGGTILAEKEIKNLIVNEASKFMAIRMAPGNIAGSNSGAIYTAGNTVGEYESQGLKFLAVGTGPCVNSTIPYNETTNPLKTIANGGWDLQSPPAETITTNTLVGELYRKKFTDWKFLDAGGNLSSSPTNILLLTTTFLESEAVGPLTEMGIFGGDAGTTVRNSGHMFNYKTFKVWNKPNDSRLSIAWKLTF